MTLGELHVGVFAGADRSCRRGCVGVPVDTRGRRQDVSPDGLCRRSREDPRIRTRGGGDQPAAPRPGRRPRRRVTRTSSPHRCSPSSTACPQSPRLCSTRRSASNFAMLVHGAQEFEWGPLVDRRRRDLDDRLRQGDRRAARARASTSSSRSRQPARRPGLPGHLDQHREGGLMPGFEVGDQIPELQVTPDRLPDRPLRRSFGRLQPDPHRRGVRQVGRPARADPPRPVLDGPGRPRPDRGRRRARQAQAPVGPVSRDGTPESEIVVTGEVTESLTAASSSRRSPSERQADHPQRRRRARARAPSRPGGG